MLYNWTYRFRCRIRADLILTLNIQGFESRYGADALWWHNQHQQLNSIPAGVHHEKCFSVCTPDTRYNTQTIFSYRKYNGYSRALGKHFFKMVNFQCL